MPAKFLRIDKGTVTGTDPAMVEEGYLIISEGVAYQPSNPAAFKLGGRTKLNSVAIAAANSGGVGFVDFDSATDRIFTQINGTLYSADPAVGTFTSIRTGLTASASYLDYQKSDADQMFVCNGLDTNWVIKSDNTTFQVGLTAIGTAPGTSLAGTGITGTFQYWTTEFDNVNGVESAFNGTAVTVTPANQTVTITKPATVNSSATHWNIYRSKDTGVFPIGWRVAQVAIGTATFADSTTDASLVLLTPYPVVSPNGISESQNLPPPVFRSLAFFEGSLVGVTNRALYYSETGLYHAFPASYVIPFRPRFGGFARCVRRVGHSLLVFFDHDTFRVNYLPKAADSFFDVGVVQEHVGNYGVTSSTGAITFSGWGGQEMCVTASRNTAMITDGNAFDQAVLNIDWPNTISLANLSSAVWIDNPDALRLELHYNSGGNNWRALHFYYDSTRITVKSGFPELAWTGPHRVPGPHAFGVVNNTGRVFSGSMATDGFIYQENTGTSDAANLVDAKGTVNFDIKTPRIYPMGISGQARCERVFIHNTSSGSADYTCTLTANNEGDQGVPKNATISSTAGATSNDFNNGGQSFDFEVTYSNALAMPNINVIVFTFDDVSEEWAKTNRRTT